MIDEADKMMDHIKQDWLEQVEDAVYSDERPRPGSLTVARYYSITMFLTVIVWEYKYCFTLTIGSSFVKIMAGMPVLNVTTCT